MPIPVFIDTNVLLYAASDGSSEPDKKRLAMELLRSRPWVLSIQATAYDGFVGQDDEGGAGG